MTRMGMAIIALVILVGLSIAVWGGSRIGTSQAQQQREEMESQLEATQTELSQLYSSYGSQRQDNIALQGYLVSTQSQLSQMQSSYGTLQQDNARVRAQLVAAESASAQTQASVSSLQQQVASLTASYNSLQARYADLEKTKQFTAADILKVQLSTEVQMAASATWIRGEVTNTGSATVPKVYVLVARYKTDGSLDRLELPPTIIMNLAPGGVGYFSFITGGDNCQVIVFGNYQ